MMMTGEEGGEIMMGAVELTPRLWKEGGEEEEERADEAVEEEGDEDEWKRDGGEAVTPDGEEL